MMQPVPNKGAKWKTVGIVAGGIGAGLLGAWLNARLRAPGAGQAMNQSGALTAGTTGLPAALPFPVDQNTVLLLPADPNAAPPYIPPGADPAAPLTRSFRPLSRGLEIETDSASNTIYAYPAAAEGGNLRLIPGQVASFRISFDHR
ncbi:MAG: hypothetical protein ABIP14_01845 [Blastocatellia bacterium]